ncbi:MAG TPA: TonB family protein [Bryobacteraceae bacterium]|nr:TonB family protein [Bryobacteraceae bacterium]
MKPHFLLSGVLAFGIAAAQDAPPAGYRIGNGVSAPVVIQKQEPQYTDEARMAKMEGTVVLALTVSAEGVPGNLRVTKSLGLGLDESAIQNVSSWRFKPGMKDGNAVPVFANVEVKFRLLLEPRQWHLSRVAFAASDGASRPVLVRATYPDSSGPSEDASVSLSFDVDEKGEPTNIQVAKSSDPKWESEVIALAGKWRFEPAMKEGRTVPVHATLDFERGARAQRAYRIGGGVTAPRVIYKVEPQYTEQARNARFEGTVILFVVITPDGHATEIKVLRPLGMGLDQAAIDCVKKWKFRPGLKEGNPVPVQATIEVNFRIRER